MPVQTVPTPHGAYTVRDADDVLVEGWRAVETAVLRVGAVRLAEVLAAPGLTTEDLAATIGLTAEEDAGLEALSDAVSWALLDGWPEGTLPAGPAAVGALPGHLRGAVADATAGPGAALLAAVMDTQWPR